MRDQCDATHWVEERKAKWQTTILHLNGGDGFQGTMSDLNRDLSADQCQKDALVR